MPACRQASPSEGMPRPVHARIIRRAGHEVKCGTADSARRGALAGPLNPQVGCCGIP